MVVGAFSQILIHPLKYIGPLKPSLKNKVHGANMGPIWDRQDPGGPHVGPMNFAICAPFY